MRRSILLLLILFGGCSSIPDFKPSKPVEEASSLNDALDLCAAYQIKGEQNALGRAKPARTVVLVPWINCFEMVFRKFPAARSRAGFVMFFRELQARHDGPPSPDSEVIDWPVMNFAVTRAIAQIKDPSIGFSAEEKDAIARMLPGYWIYLAESGNLAEPVARSAVRSQQLEELKRELGDVNPEPRRLPPRPTPLNAEQRQFCKKYLKHRALLYNVEELGDYKRVMSEATYGDVSNSPNANEQAMRDRVEKRFSALKEQALSGKRELDTELAALQAKTRWFQAGYCLEGAASLKVKENND